MQKREDTSSSVICTQDQEKGRKKGQRGKTQRERDIGEMDGRVKEMKVSKSERWRRGGKMRRGRENKGTRSRKGKQSLS